jgi:hypothetical protein
MSITVSSFAPSTKIESAVMNTNFNTLTSVLNNLRPTYSAFMYGVVEVATNIVGSFIIKSNQTLYFDEVALFTKTAPVGSALIIDIKKNGSTIFSTKPQINDGSTSGGSLAIFSTSSVVKNDIITVDVTQIGSTTAGSDLSINLSFKL